MNPDMKERVQVVFECVKTVFHWGFIPAVLYLGERRNKNFNEMCSVPGSYQGAYCNEN